MIAIQSVEEAAQEWSEWRAAHPAKGQSPERDVPVMNKPHKRVQEAWCLFRLQRGSRREWYLVPRLVSCGTSQRLAGAPEEPNLMQQDTIERAAHLAKSHPLLEEVRWEKDSSTGNST